MAEEYYVLRSWVPMHKLNWDWLSVNPHAVQLLKENRRKINYEMLYANPNARYIVPQGNVSKRWKEIDWQSLAHNPNVHEFYYEYIALYNHCKRRADSLRTHEEKLRFWDKTKFDYFTCYLWENPSAIDILLYIVNDASTAAYHEFCVDWIGFSSNPRAVEYLAQHPEKIDWESASENPNAIEWLLANPSKIRIRGLCANTDPRAIDYLRRVVVQQRPDHPSLDKQRLSKNPSAVPLLREHSQLISWKELAQNPHPAAMELIADRLESVPASSFQEWAWDLSCNPHAVELLKTRFPEKIVWRGFSRNPNAVEMIAERYRHRHKRKSIDLDMLSINPNIFTYDYQKLMQRMRDSGIAEGLAAYFFPLGNRGKWKDWGFDDCAEIEDMCAEDEAPHPETQEY